MSRIGKKPIAIPVGVTVTHENGTLTVKGPKGQDMLMLHPMISVTQEGAALQVHVSEPEEKQGRALWGLHRALIANMVQGVQQGFEKKLEMVGVGYKSALQGRNLTLEVGFSHPVVFSIPEGLNVSVEKNAMTITGLNKQAVGAFASKIRAIRKPEPYKGKGIKYAGEVIRRKAGKAAKAAGAK